ncbi:hypothetical protein GOB57_24495 [Sinorhizobium meliloti]|nr:hypothetical protein [Sinorhizobium meliloti]
MTSSFFIGDVHGRLDLLERMLAHIETLRSEGDRVVHLGDIVDRGPEARDVSNLFA